MLVIRTTDELYSSIHWNAPSRIALVCAHLSSSNECSANQASAALACENTLSPNAALTAFFWSCDSPLYCPWKVSKFSSRISSSQSAGLVMTVPAEWPARDLLYVTYTFPIFCWLLFKHKFLN